MLHLYPWECLVIISAGGSLVLVWHQVCTWTNADLSSVRSRETHFCAFFFKFQTFSSIKIYFKTSFLWSLLKHGYHQASDIAHIKFRPQIISYPVDINMVQIFIVICCLVYQPLPIPCHSVSVITALVCQFHSVTADVVWSFLPNLWQSQSRFHCKWVCWMYLE